MKRKNDMIKNSKSFQKGGKVDAPAIAAYAAAT